MKKTYFLLHFCVIFATLSVAQSPLAIPFQGILRDSTGALLGSHYAALRLTIHDATSGGSVDYQERDSVTTNYLGLFTLNIGAGEVLSGSFSGINWSSAAKYLQVEMDPTGGSSYTSMGTTQLNSVPFALFAANSAGDRQPASQIAYGNSSGNSLTSDQYFVRNDSNQHTNILCHTGAGLSEGLQVGGGFLYGAVPDGTFLLHQDSTEAHIDLVGAGNFSAFGSPHGVGIACIKNMTSNGPLAAVLLQDSEPVNTVIKMETSNAALTSYQGQGLISPYQIQFAINKGENNSAALILDTNFFSIQVDTDTWNWPTNRGTAGQVLTIGTPAGFAATDGGTYPTGTPLVWSSTHLPHTILAATGYSGSINLSDNVYNIINTPDTLSTLSLGLPAFPANNDIMELKFLSAISTITFSYGTVADGISSATAGTYVKLVYDTTTTTWY